jgi:NAD(P)-dependent dehydrogenase (short-subunit alcohol dehydrogenase family)
MRDQTIFITGATDGLGRAVARQCAAGGATVLLHGRSRERGKTTADEIATETGSDRLTYYNADLSDLAQVRALAANILSRHTHLDVVVHNAGVGPGEPGASRQLSVDGHELRFAVNYLAPYLLTRLLVPAILASQAARIVNVASGAQAPLDFDDLMLSRNYTGLRAYSQSKLALVMLTFDLADELQDGGVASTCLHPATLMPTKMVRESGFGPVSALEPGLEATMRLVSSREPMASSGRYFDGINQANADPQAYDRQARARLRQLSAQLVDMPT